MSITWSAHDACIVQTPYGAFRGTVEDVCDGAITVVYLVDDEYESVEVNENEIWVLSDPTAPQV